MNILLHWYRRVSRRDEKYNLTIQVLLDYRGIGVKCLHKTPRITTINQIQNGKITESINYRENQWYVSTS